jgi:hypothetical protein
VSLGHDDLPTSEQDVVMSDFQIFLNKPEWNELLASVTRILCIPGVDRSGEMGRTHVWRLIGVDIVAIDQPELDDDVGIAFSTFTSELIVEIHDRVHLKEAEDFREALAVLLALQLKTEVDPATRLVWNLQKEINLS